MMYLVDFSGTIFDLSAFEAYERTRSTREPFEPGELSRFLYPDARGFLMDKGNAAIIVTAAEQVANANFMQSALHGIPRIAVMYTGGKPKGESLAPHIAMYGQSPVFVDDSPEHLTSMETSCPGVRLFQMCRGEREGDGRWPIVRSLVELP